MNNTINPEANTRLEKWIKAFPRIAGMTAIAAGAIVLIGWMSDIPVLKSLHPDLVSMKANTALAFVLAGMSLLLHDVPGKANWRRTADFLAFLVLLIGLITVAEYVFKWDAGIDQLLFNEPQGTIGTFLPGRMALNSAMGSCLFGLSLLTLKRRSRWSDGAAQVLALVVSVLGLFALVAYTYGVHGSSGFAVYTRMALHTAGTFTLLSLGLICLQPNVGVVAVIRGEGLGGFMARRLMLVAVVVPVLLGWLTTSGEIRGWYGSQFGNVIDVTAVIAIFVFLVWTLGRSVNKLDAERRNLEHTIIRSEKKFRGLFDDAPVGYHEFNHDGRLTRVNQTELRMLGYEAGEMLGRFVWEFLDDQEASRQSVLAKLADTKSPAKSGVRVYRRKDAMTISVVSEDRLLQDADGRITGIRTTLQDITELKHSQDLLHQSEERFRQVAESAGEWIWETDAHGLYTFSSFAVQTILGYNPEEIVGKKYFYDFFTPDVRDELKHAALNAFEQKEPVHAMINTNLHKNGNVVILETTGVPVLDENGKLLGYRGADTNITARKRAEEALVAERSLLRTLVDNLPDGIYLKDAACRKTLANPADVRNMGASLEAEVLGKTDFDFYPHELAAAFHTDDQSVVQSGRPVLNREEMITLPDKTIGWLLTSRVPLRDSAGQVIGLMGISHDITERKQAEHERESLIKELKDALDNVRTLAGLVPICSSCKKIRDDKGFWNQLEHYLAEHTDAKFTHGLCPDCAEAYFPGLAAKT